jgi:RNA polymerase sigma-70 factor (ECF subfamily)
MVELDVTFGRSAVLKGEMELTRYDGATPAVVGRAAPRRTGIEEDRTHMDDRAPVPGPPRGNVRPDLGEVFRREYRLVVGVAARVLGSPDQADDVAQDVFLSFARSSVPGDDARGWLAVAAAHTALNLLRSGRRRATREATTATRDTVTSDVADDVVTGEERGRVRAALGRLPRTQAVALVLRHSGLSYADVAAALDLSPTSVGTTVRRAESALRKELNRHATSE